MKKPNAGKCTFGNQNLRLQLKDTYAALITLPPLIQRVQTFIRTFPPCGRCVRMDCRFGLNRRRVLLFACETLFPNCGPLPQTSHRFAISLKASKYNNEV